MQLDERPTFTFLDRIHREGGPIPVVDPGHMKGSWKLVRDCPANKAIGLGSTGLSIDEGQVLGIRLNLLRSLFERGVLRDHLVDGEITDQTFQAAATLPCDWEDCCEAFMQLHLKQSSEETVSKARELFAAQGYDPDKPKIDSKFIAWMRDHQC